MIKEITHMNLENTKMCKEENKSHQSENYWHYIYPSLCSFSWCIDTYIFWDLAKVISYTADSFSLYIYH